MLCPGLVPPALEVQRECGSDRFRLIRKPALQPRADHVVQEAALPLGKACIEHVLIQGMVEPKALCHGAVWPGTDAIGC